MGVYMCVCVCVAIVCEGVCVCICVCMCVCVAMCILRIVYVCERLLIWVFVCLFPTLIFPMTVDGCIRPSALINTCQSINQADLN